jgi:hypothetical protein
METSTLGEKERWVNLALAALDKRECLSKFTSTLKKRKSQMKLKKPASWLALLDLVTPLLLHRMAPSICGDSMFTDNSESVIRKPDGVLKELSITIRVKNFLFSLKLLAVSMQLMLLINLANLTLGVKDTLDTLV